jgi:hypothetical protein
MEWISVKERLPKESGDYLITDTGTCFVSYFDVEEQKWEFFGVEFWKHEEVTHWMPLPEPPKE